MKHIVHFFCLFLLGSGIFAQPAFDLSTNLPFDPTVRSGKLINGITYLVKKNGKPEKRAELRLVVRVGSMMEEDDQQGLAHFCEHLCFNGTEHFPKSALVDYLESVGTKFGPHLNAYTSFDETVYMIQLPTDDDLVFKKGIQILEEWAHLVTFDDEEIEKERGVVISERRNGLGADKRMSDKIYPVIFKQSRYAERLPIGQLEVLDTFPPARVKDFYRKWYTSGNMAVIAVGDFDIAKVEQLIRQQFDRIPAVRDAALPVVYEVPDHDETLIAIATDPEATMTSLGVMIKHPATAILTGQDLRTQLIRSLCNEMINQRLEELRQQPNAPFTFGSAGFNNLVRSKSAFNLSISMSESQLIPAMEMAFMELERLKRHGFLDAELDRARKNLLRRMESAFQEKDKTNSASIVGGLVAWFLRGNPYPGIDFTWKFYQDYLSGIAVEETNQMIFQWLKDSRNTVITLRAPEKEGFSPPGDREIAILYRSYKRRDDILQYVDQFVDKPLLEKIPSPGKIVSEKALPAIGATEWRFSNGARVIVKKTDFKNDEIMLQAHSWGGSSLVNEADADDADYAGAILAESGVGPFSKMELIKNLSGKRVSVYPFVGEISEGISANFSPKDQETALQLIHLYFTQPRIDPQGFENFLKQRRIFLENKNARPESVFADSLNYLLSNYHPRRKPQDISLLNGISPDRSLELFRQRFSNAGDFTFYLVGNIDLEKSKEQIATYIGSLPGEAANKEQYHDLGIRYPDGVISKTMERGIESKSNVYLIFTGKASATLQSEAEMQALVKLLQIKMREAIREDKGGSYGVSVGGHISKHPNEAFYLSISFGCDPARVEELTAVARGVIREIMANGASETDLTKIKEGFRREFETAFKENRFWMNVMTAVDQDQKPIEPYASSDQLYQLYGGITSEDLQKLAAQYCNETNCITYILKPEAKP